VRWTRTCISASRSRGARFNIYLSTVTPLHRGGWLGGGPTAGASRFHLVLMTRVEYGIEGVVMHRWQSEREA